MADPKQETKMPEAPHEARKLTKRPVQVHFPKNAPLVAPTDFYQVIERAYANRCGIKASVTRLVVNEIYLVQGVGIGFRVRNKSEGKTYDTDRVVPWASVAGVDFEP